MKFSLVHSQLGKVAWFMYSQTADKLRMWDSNLSVMCRSLMKSCIREILTVNRIANTFSASKFSTITYAQIRTAFKGIFDYNMIYWFMHRYCGDTAFSRGVVEILRSDYTIETDKMEFAGWLYERYIGEREEKRSDYTADVSLTNLEVVAGAYSELAKFRYLTYFDYYCRIKWTVGMYRKIAKEFNIILSDRAYWLTDGQRVGGINSELVKYDTKGVKPVKSFVDRFDLISAEIVCPFTNMTLIKAAAVRAASAEMFDFLLSMVADEIDFFSSDWGIFDEINEDIDMILSKQVL